MILLPYIMPVVGTVMLVELLFAQMGLVNEALYTWGLPIYDWLHSKYAFWVVILLYLWKNTGYSVILLLSGLTVIPEDQYDAAAIDGASASQQLCYITIPQMWYSVFFAMVFSLINAFKCFREIFLIGGTHPDDSVYMLQHVNTVVRVGAADQEDLPEALEGVDQGEYHGEKHAVPHLGDGDIAELLGRRRAIDGGGIVLILRDHRQAGQEQYHAVARVFPQVEQDHHPEGVF